MDARVCVKPLGRKKESVYASRRATGRGGGGKEGAERRRVKRGASVATRTESRYRNAS